MTSLRKLLRLGLLSLLALPWLMMLGATGEKLVHPQQKNLHGDEWVLAGAALLGFTALVLLGFRRR